MESAHFCRLCNSKNSIQDFTHSRTTEPSLVNGFRPTRIFSAILLHSEPNREGNTVEWVHKTWTWPHAVSPEVALDITKRDPFPHYILLPNFDYFHYSSFYPDFTRITLFQEKIHSVNYYESATFHISPKCYSSLEKAMVNFQSKFFLGSLSSVWFFTHIEINWSPISQLKKKNLSFIHSISSLFFSTSVASHRPLSYLFWPGNPMQSLFMDLLSCDKEYLRKFSVWEANFLRDFSPSWLLTNRRNFFFVFAMTYSCLLDPLSQISSS